MSVSAVSSNAAPLPVSSGKPAVVARAADGDYKVRTPGTSQVKDADGDYKPGAASGSAGQSSAAVQSALAILKVGG